MTEVPDVAERFSELLSHRLFVDHEPGSLLVWVDADSGHVATLVRQVERGIRRRGSQCSGRALLSPYG